MSEFAKLRTDLSKLDEKDADTRTFFVLKQIAYALIAIGEAIDRKGIDK